MKVKDLHKVWLGLVSVLCSQVKVVYGPLLRGNVFSAAELEFMADSLVMETPLSIAQE